MGFFSWKTQDTDESIANNCSDRPVIPVYMTDDKGNQWYEPDYSGYGEFGGKDFYELLAEMNGLGPDRSEGINLAYSGTSYKSPNLTESKTHQWVKESPEDCEYQGFFYPGDEEEEDDDWGGNDEEEEEY
jgi:hypothetical protein